MVGKTDIAVLGEAGFLVELIVELLERFVGEAGFIVESLICSVLVLVGS